ncbi:MAG: MoxR family ATPase [Chitinophagaceae bacterium]|nr:MoxR family ATPase [Chitinophagaceae bacterium]
MEIKLDTIVMEENPIDYVAEPRLVKAVEAAIALGKPLLVSGEPGTGKSRLASFVAAQLAKQTENRDHSFLDKPYIFNTKSTSVATDLFYSYDAVGHFRARDDQRIESFIELRALGLAIAQTHGLNALQHLNIGKVKNIQSGRLSSEPRSSVVLIDEIDKAPREFPNDLLFEIEQNRFEIKEMNEQLGLGDNDSRIIIIMTSNSEKNLPNAFLRRCVFYHIPFPDKEMLKKIALARLKLETQNGVNNLEKLIEVFNRIRNVAVNKKPSTSEFLDWVNLLRYYGLLKNQSLPPAEEDKDYAKWEAATKTLIKSYDDELLIHLKSLGQS